MIKSNDRMPARSATNIELFMSNIRSWNSKHRGSALRFADEIGASELFEIMHSMRRWYSGQTMARRLLLHRPALLRVMKLGQCDVVGVFRGFKVDKAHGLASIEPGTTIELPVTRNHGISSWSMSEDLVNRFSGAGNGKVGVIVKLVDGKGTTPILAPPSHTDLWFDELYAYAIGTSFRPKESEYLIAAHVVNAQIVRIKK